MASRGDGPLARLGGEEFIGPLEERETPVGQPVGQHVPHAVVQRLMSYARAQVPA